MLNKINDIIEDLLTRPDYRVYRHLLVQLTVLLITMSIFWDEPDRLLPERFGAWIVYFLLLDAIIYLNIYLLVPRLLLAGRSVRYILSLLLTLLLAGLAIGLMQEIAGDNDTQSTPLLFNAIISTLSTFAAFGFLIAGLTVLLLTKNRAVNIKKINELEAATMSAELSHLQKQINPHFLFNMLNNANILAAEDAEKSWFTLTKLNELLKYQIAGSSKASVRLSGDIAFLKNYLELEKIRRDRFEYAIITDGNDGGVPPLLFIPFVENAVKHNPENDSYVNIVFQIKDNRLYFECENPKAKSIHRPEKGGLGLINVKKRLDLLFRKDYTLDLLDEKEKYTVKMEFNVFDS